MIRQSSVLRAVMKGQARAVVREAGCKPTIRTWPSFCVSLGIGGGHIFIRGWSPTRRLARSMNSQFCILSRSFVGLGGIPLVITDEEALGLSDEGSFLDLPAMVELV